MNTERAIQALLRAVVVAVAAAATAVGVDAANIVQIGTDDPILSKVILSVILGAVQFVLKYVGGPTEPMPEATIRGFTGTEKVTRPNILSV